MSEKFICDVPLCGRTFQNESRLSTHQQRRHPELFGSSTVQITEKNKIEKIVTEKGYDLDAIEQDLKDMDELQNSVMQLANQAGDGEEQNLQQEFSSYLLKGDLESIRNKGKMKNLPEDCKKVDYEMVLEASHIDGELISKDSFPGMELVEEIYLKNMKLSQFSKNGKFNPFDLKSLQKLDLSDNFLSSVVPLESCFNLEWLDVSNNLISDFHSLEYCPKLKTLLANKNQARSLADFAHFESLKVLELEDNQIDNVEQNLDYLSNMKELEELVLKGNDVRNFIL